MIETKFDKGIEDTRKVSMSPEEKAAIRSSILEYARENPLSEAALGQYEEYSIYLMLAKLIDMVKGGLQNIMMPWR
jgi:hypothetical protein